MVIGAKEKDKAEYIGLPVLGLEIDAYIVLCSVIRENLYELSLHLIRPQNFWASLITPQLPCLAEEYSRKEGVCG